MACTTGRTCSFGDHAERLAQRWMGVGLQRGAAESPPDQHVKSIDARGAAGLTTAISPMSLVCGKVQLSVESATPILNFLGKKCLSVNGIDGGEIWRHQLLRHENLEIGRGVEQEGI